MTKKLLRLAGVLLLAVLLGMGGARAAEKPQVAVTVKPLHSLVAGLMAGVAEPVLLLDGSKVPYGQTLDAAQKKLVAESDLVIWAGPELESMLVEAMENRQGPVLTLLDDEQLKILPARYADEPSVRDPFFWLDIRNAEVLIDQLADAVAAVDPDNAEAYLRNRAQVKVMAAKLDRVFEYGYRAVAAGPVFLYHDTQQYFAQAYALDEAGFVAPAPTAVPDGAGLLGAVQDMRNAGAACLLVEKGLPQDNLSLLLDGAGVRMATLDSFALGYAPGPDLYPAMMHDSFAAISGCFPEPKKD